MRLPPPPPITEGWGAFPRAPPPPETPHTSRTRTDCSGHGESSANRAQDPAWLDKGSHCRQAGNEAEGAGEGLMRVGSVRDPQVWSICRGCAGEQACAGTSVCVQGRLGCAADGCIALSCQTRHCQPLASTKHSPLTPLAGVTRDFSFAPSQSSWSSLDGSEGLRVLPEGPDSPLSLSSSIQP